jgi:nucleoside-diphosphate-sugar epimerase
MASRALIAGVSGIVGNNLASHLVSKGWEVFGLARKPQVGIEGARPVAADLLDPESLRTALAGVDPTHVFITTWMRQATEAENCAVNGAMVRNLFDSLGEAKSLRHAALVTGLKHYLGPFEAYARSKPVTPFREEMPRLPYANFYYTQEDEVFDAAKRLGFTWSVHRPHTIIGYALGNAMNMGVTLAVYAAICRETGRPFVFPGSPQQWDGLTDVTDARVLAKQLEWAATSEAARDQAFNIVNGDIFRWNWLWPKLAADFGIEDADYPGRPTPLEPQLAQAGPVWAGIAAKHGLAEPDITRLASAWHTDMDLGREMEVVTDMTRSRVAGFHDYQPTIGSFLELFARLRRERIIPDSGR